MVFSGEDKNLIKKCIS